MQGVIQIGRRRWAANLYWQPSDSAKVRRAALDAARRPEQPADFYCVRPVSMHRDLAQFGLGSRELGHRWRMPSAAAAVAQGQSQVGSWAGAWRVGPQWWVVVVREDIIEARGDTLYASEDEARERIEREKSRGGLVRVFAPADWRIPNADNAPLELLLGGGSGDCALVPARGGKRLIGLGVAAAGVVAGLATLLINGAENVRVPEVVQSVQPQAPTPPPPPPPRWVDQPRPGDWLRACREAIGPVEVGSLGWALVGVECSGDRAIVQWRRTSGRAVPPVGAVIDEVGQNATRELQLSGLTPRGQETLWPRRVVTELVLRDMREASFTILPDDRPAGTPDFPNPPPAPWLKRELNVAAGGTPWRFGPFFDAFPGVVIEAVRWAGLKEGWVLRATLYEARRDG